MCRRRRSSSEGQRFQPEAGELARADRGSNCYRQAATAPAPGRDPPARGGPGDRLGWPWCHRHSLGGGGCAQILPCVLKSLLWCERPTVCPGQPGASCVRGHEPSAHRNGCAPQYRQSLLVTRAGKRRLSTLPQRRALEKVFPL